MYHTPSDSSAWCTPHDVRVVERCDVARLVEHARVWWRRWCGAAPSARPAAASTTSRARKTSAWPPGSEAALDDVVADRGSHGRRCRVAGLRSSFLVVLVLFSSGPYRRLGSVSASVMNSRRLAGSCTRGESRLTKSWYCPKPRVAGVEAELGELLLHDQLGERTDVTRERAEQAVHDRLADGVGHRRVALVAVAPRTLETDADASRGLDCETAAMPGMPPLCEIETLPELGPDGCA